jgi:hypothetical protein
MSNYRDGQFAAIIRTDSTCSCCPPAAGRRVPDAVVSDEVDVEPVVVALEPVPLLESRRPVIWTW